MDKSRANYILDCRSTDSTISANNMEVFSKLIAIAVGGSAGAVARYLINVSPLSGIFERFPLPTFLINVSGSFLIGFLFIFLNDRVVVSDNVRAALIIGFLGAFTTFSTFELEIYALLKDGVQFLAILYLLSSIVAGFLAVIAGIYVGREI